VNVIEFLRARLRGEPPVHPIERMMAKRWVKERLKVMDPSLRTDPRALEAAYRRLSIEALPGAGEGGETLFEVIVPQSPGHHY
jgi:hypothetical protein